jgi:hypothetical protein
LGDIDFLRTREKKRAVIDEDGLTKSIKARHQIVTRTDESDDQPDMDQHRWT